MLPHFKRFFFLLKGYFCFMIAKNWSLVSRLDVDIFTFKPMHALLWFMSKVTSPITTKVLRPSKENHFIYIFPNVNPKSVKRFDVTSLQYERMYSTVNLLCIPWLLRSLCVYPLSFVSLRNTWIKIFTSTEYSNYYRQYSHVIS